MRVILTVIVVIGSLLSFSYGGDAPFSVAHSIAAVDDGFGGFYILDGARSRLVHIVPPDSLFGDVSLNGVPLGVVRLGLEIAVICENNPVLYFFSRRLEPSGLEELSFIPRGIAATSSRRLFLTDRVGALYIRTEAGALDKIAGLPPIERIVSVWGKEKIIAFTQDSIVKLDDRGLIVGRLKLPIPIGRIVSAAADTACIAIASDSLLYFWDGTKWREKFLPYLGVVLASSDDGFYGISQYGIHPIEH